jgi:putative NIF3 family GTP cyclohydrolase 1 type 2
MPVDCLVDADLLYHAWLAALARSNHVVAGDHAQALLRLLQHGEEHPQWSTEAQASFLAWCVAAGLAIDQRVQGRS